MKVVSAQLYINSMDEIKHNAEKAQPELTAVADMLPGYQVKTQVLLGSAPGLPASLGAPASAAAPDASAPAPAPEFLPTQPAPL